MNPNDPHQQPTFVAGDQPAPTDSHQPKKPGRPRKRHEPDDAELLDLVETAIRNAALDILSERETDDRKAAATRVIRGELRRILDEQVVNWQQVVVAIAAQRDYPNKRKLMALYQDLDQDVDQDEKVAF